MNIGILGSGRIGGTTADLFAVAGNQVAIANSRDGQELEEVVASIGPRAKATTPEEAVKFGEVVLLALPWTKRDQLPNPQLFANKIVIDALNPYGPNGVEDLGNTTSSEEVARQLPQARVVKAFNTMYYETLRNEGQPGTDESQRLVLFVAGDDAQAKQTVMDLIRQIGFAPVDVGSLPDGRKQQPDSPIYNQPMHPEEARKRLAAL